MLSSDPSLNTFNNITFRGITLASNNVTYVDLIHNYIKHEIDAEIVDEPEPFYVVESKTKPPVTVIPLIRSYNLKSEILPTMTQGPILDPREVLIVVAATKQYVDHIGITRYYAGHQTKVKPVDHIARPVIMID
jgi:hypothetical protein